MHGPLPCGAPSCGIRPRRQVPPALLRARRATRGALLRFPSLRRRCRRPWPVRGFCRAPQFRRGRRQAGCRRPFLPPARLPRQPGQQPSCRGRPCCRRWFLRSSSLSPWRRGFCRSFPQRGRAQGFPRCRRPSSRFFWVGRRVWVWRARQQRHPASLQKRVRRFCARFCRRSFRRRFFPGNGRRARASLRALPETLGLRRPVRRPQGNRSLRSWKSFCAGRRPPRKFSGHARIPGGDAPRSAVGARKGEMHVYPLPGEYVFSENMQEGRG